MDYPEISVKKSKEWRRKAPLFFSFVSAYLQTTVLSMWAKETLKPKKL